MNIFINNQQNDQAMVIFKTNLRQIGEDRHLPRGEIKFYNNLKVLNDNWLVWFSQEWYNISQEGVDYSEADFLLFNRNYGFIVIEVKGGNVSIDKYGNWYSKNGKVRIKDPFKQARKSMYFFNDLYVDNAYSLSKNSQINTKELLRKNKYFPGVFTYAVVFPDCNFKESLKYNHSHINKHLVFDADDLRENLSNINNESSHLEMWLKNIFYEQNNNYDINSMSLTQSKLFINSIGDEISTKIKIVDWLDYKAQKLKLINLEQDRIIRFMRYVKDAAILGSAGTGKTFIAIKKIKDILLQNSDNPQKILFLCYNVALKGFLMDIFRNMINDQSKRIINRKSKVVFHSIESYISIITRKYLKKENKEKFKEYQDAIKPNDKDTIRDIMIYILENYDIDEKEYDAIIIDEAQDFPISYFDFIKRLLKKNGIYWTFYDDSQTLWKDSAKELKLFKLGHKKDIQKYILTSNLRNLRHIVEWFRDETNYGNYIEILSDSKEKVSIKKVSTFEDALTETFEILNYLKENSIDLDKISVLAEGKRLKLLKSNRYPVKKQHIPIKNKGYSLVFYEIEENSLKISEPEKKFFKKYHLLKKYSKKYHSVHYSTISSFKGLENDIIVLLIQSKTNGISSHLKQIYVGASRAKLLLYVIEFKK